MKKDKKVKIGPIDCGPADGPTWPLAGLSSELRRLARRGTGHLALCRRVDAALRQGRNATWYELEMEVVAALETYAPPCVFFFWVRTNQDYGFYLANNWPDVAVARGAVIAADVKEIPYGYKGESIITNAAGIAMYSHDGWGRKRQIWSVSNDKS